MKGELKIQGKSVRNRGGRRQEPRKWQRSRFSAMWPLSGTPKLSAKLTTLTNLFVSVFFVLNGNRKGTEFVSSFFVCYLELHLSSWQCQILNPLSEARDQTHILMVTSQVCYHRATTGTPGLSFNSEETGRDKERGGRDDQVNIQGTPSPLRNLHNLGETLDFTGHDTRGHANLTWS